MPIQIESLSLPPSANPKYFADFGKEIKEVNPAELTPEQFKEIEQLLYKVFSSLCISMARTHLVTTKLAFHLAVPQRHCVARAAICAH